MTKVSSSNGLEKCPKLRFPGFNEAIKANNLSKYLVENKDRNKALVYDQSDVLSVSGEYGVVNQIEFQGRSFAGKSVADYHLVETNDIVYTKSPLKANPYGIIKVNKGVTGIVSTLYAVYHPLPDVVPQYIDYYFDYDLRLNKYLKPLVNIGAKHDMKVDNETVLTGEVFFPSCSEQKKIVDFLTTIDKLIRKKRTLVDALKKYKRGAVRYLLSTKSCPLRNARWTTAKIGELGSFVKGAPLSKADISEDGTPFILYGELYTTYNEVVTSIKRRTKAQVDEIFLSHVGDVVIPTSGETPEEISTASCIMLPNVILAGDLNIFRGDKVDGRILSYLLNHVVNTKIARIAQGKSVVHIQASELCKLTLTYPDKNTQKTIIGFLSLLNDKIMNEENSLAFLSDLKEGLMQQLFI